MENTADFFMRTALQLAGRGGEQGEVPVGALIELGGTVIGEGFNCPIAESDPAAHAEIIAMRAAGKNIGNYRLTGSILYVTLEPCVMCYSAAVHARVGKIVYGAADPKGGIFSTGVFDQIKEIYNHSIQVDSGILAKESSDLLKNFFRERR